MTTAIAKKRPSTQSEISTSKTDPLLKARKKQFELTTTFKAALDSQLIRQRLDDTETFSDILRFAFENGLIKQSQLAERLHYANSQVGRWAAGKASPPLIVKEAVIRKISDMLEEFNQHSATG